MKKKKKKYVETKFRYGFKLKWKCLKGTFPSNQKIVPGTKGYTTLYAETEDDAIKEFLTTANFADRKFKVISVTEVGAKEKKPKRNINTEHEHYDDIPI